jgi:hypothetical protein
LPFGSQQSLCALPRLLRAPHFLGLLLRLSPRLLGSANFLSSPRFLRGLPVSLGTRFLGASEFFGPSGLFSKPNFLGPLCLGSLPFRLGSSLLSSP